MPKLVDPQARRETVADAVLAVVARDGLPAATLRNVADEAGLAIGSVRHYFAGHHELIIFAVRELDRRIGGRVWAHATRIRDSLASAGSRAERRILCVRLLAEWLPLDEARRREAVLRHTFLVAARTDEQLREHADALRDTMAAIVRRVLSEARAAGGLPPALDVELETVRLCALLEGLSAPGALSARDVGPGPLDVLRHHLDGLL